MDVFVIIASIIAAIVVVVILRLVYVRELLVPMPAPVDGEDMHRLSVEELEMLQRWAEDFVLYVVINKKEQDTALEAIASWKEATSIREVVQSLVSCLGRLETVSYRRVKMELNALLQACEGISTGNKVECFVVSKLVVLRAAIFCLAREMAPAY